MQLRRNVRRVVRQPGLTRKQTAEDVQIPSVDAFLCTGPCRQHVCTSPPPILRPAFTPSAPSCHPQGNPLRAAPMHQQGCAQGHRYPIYTIAEASTISSQLRLYKRSLSCVPAQELIWILPPAAASNGLRQMVLVTMPRALPPVQTHAATTACLLPIFPIWTGMCSFPPWKTGCALIPRAFPCPAAIIPAASIPRARTTSSPGRPAPAPPLSTRWPACA